jgi:hypothetical protein
VLNVNPLPGSIFAWGAQLVEGTEAKDYYPTETRLNITRLDYSLGSCPSILVEPQRTNLARFSEQFDNAFWSKQGSTTITANTTIAPNGILSADTLSGADGTGVTGNVLRRNTIDLVDPATWSIWVKSLGATTVSLYMRNGSTGVVTSSTHSIDSNWKRITLTGVIRLGQITIGGTDGDVAIWGAQLEVGSYATSYIPTPGDFDVTRNADVISKTGISSLIDGTQGTLFIEASSLANDGTTKYFSINNGTTGKEIVFQFTSTNNTVGIRYINATIQTDTFYTIPNTLQMNKFVYTWQANKFELWYDGTKVISDTSGSVTTGFDRIEFNRANATIPFYSQTKAIALWKSVLTDDQCIQLTTI